MSRHGNPAATLLVWSIRGYQRIISPALPRRCKYYPSCSQYAVDALRQYGVFRGAVLTGWRLLRCNPLSYGGYDPVERQRLFAPRGGVGTALESVPDGAETVTRQAGDPGADKGNGLGARIGDGRVAGC